MGSFEINSAELGTIISQYQRIGRDLSNYSGRIRRATQRLNSQKGFGIETARNNPTHLSSNSNAHSRDMYIFGGFLKDLETESTNAENQVSKGMYDATPTKMSLTQLVAGALAILVGFVFSKPLIAPIAAWLAALIAKGKSTGMPNTLPTPGLTPKPAFPPVSEPIVCGNGIGITGEPVLIPPITGGDPSTIGGVIGGAAVGGAVAGGMAGGATGVEEPAEHETPAPEPAIDPNAGNGNDTIILNDGSEIHVDDLKEGMQISRNGSSYNNTFPNGQCTNYAQGRIKEITGVDMAALMDKNRGNSSYKENGRGWLNGNAFHTDTANGGCITSDLGVSVGFRNGGIPQRGNVMSFSRYEPWGHVAVVEKVVPLGNGDYQILYSDANAGKPGQVKSVRLSDIKKRQQFHRFYSTDIKEIL